MANSNGAEARQAVVDFLIGEVWGQPAGNPVWALPLPAADSNGVVQLKKDDYSTYFDAETDEPIVQGLRPEYQFGTGILHAPEGAGRPASSQATDDDDTPVDASVVSGIDVPTFTSTVKVGSDEGDEFGLTMSQRKRPSAMGLTFHAHLNSGDAVKLRITGARYEPIKVSFESASELTWYKRVPFDLAVEYRWDDVSQKPNQLIPTTLGSPLTNLASAQMRWRASKALDAGGRPLKTLTVVLKHLGKENEDIFQVGIEVTIEGQGFIGSPDRARFVELADEEQEEIELLYRHTGAFASGHGLAATWDPDQVSDEMTIKSVRATAVPTFHQEVLSTAVDGLQLSMEDLANCKTQDELSALLQPLIHGYEDWISSEEQRTKDVPAELSAAAKRVSEKARTILSRMKHGLELLTSPENAVVFDAFKIANQAMKAQQRSGRLPLREFVDEKNAPRVFKPVEEPKVQYGNWRPFQMGFILMSIAGIIDEKDESRENVDLIFFPTGGGKTEAYLGLAAFTIALRRLNDPSHNGVDVLMRYTLRLLTIQQFERSSALIVALESMRRKDPRLGTNPISIGVWLGSATTPNTTKNALKDFRDAIKSPGDAGNRFLISRCPSCGAQIGLGKKVGWVGVQENKSTKSISFVCPDRSCEFSYESKPLPIFVIDDEVYAQRPTFLLATVDKFARLAWVPEARAIFNIDASGKREGLPPALIIQDELHLISGPLGSMVGLYEPVIQELATYEKDGQRIRPKIVASTATTRRYEDQIRALYGDCQVTLFPQAVSRANETFFSSIQREEDGTPSKGTLYVGLNPATYSDTQMAASRVAAALSQAPTAWTGERESMDFYETSMWFFNSLKDLGMTLTLLQSVVIDVISGMRLYRRLPSSKFRQVWPIKELTGRIAANEVAESLTELARNSWDDNFIRTCLASSIMEVGVDVQRLGLLTIMGQPKSTAQYIQVSGRVGRARDLGPGLVVMLYNSGRARDRSVYEKFMSYHQRLYAQVEPVSATPFAIESMKHGLVGAILSHYRSTNAAAAASATPSEEVFELALEVMKSRLVEITNDPLKLADLQKQAKSFFKKWKKYEPTLWNYSMDKEKNQAPDDVDTALMRARREPIADIDDQSELVPSSLRNVDGQTQLRPVANPYQEVGDE